MALGTEMDQETVRERDLEKEMGWGPAKAKASALEARESP
jgi:hypothetical protein